MGNINVLDKHLAELIAAGEVVERPCSVIKELVENCIDAGATMITVETKNGGTAFMRVTDNGIGISRDDVPKAFLRNATSKVQNQDDLDKIATLGFRGEALASITAVSRVEMMTKTKNQEVGVKYEINGGEEVFFDDFGCPDGTTIIVKDIFYNTPARMKFLKKDVSESNAIAGVLDRIALSHPEISIKYIRDGKQTLSTVGDGKLKSCIFSVYGRDFLNSLMPIKYELNGVKVLGYISKPTMSRPNRSMQHFFINSRYVKSRTAMVAIEEAYKHSIMVGKFPACVLYINLSYEAVDVNVHPSKIEVRFINEKPVFDAVYHGVKSALIKDDSKIQMTFPTSSNNLVENKEEYIKKEEIEENIQEYKQEEEEKEPEVFIPKHTIISQNTEKSSNNISRVEIIDQEEEKKEDEDESLDDILENEQQEIKSFEKSQEKNEKVKVIGEAFNTYIITEQDGELVLIDKHAVHERMIYEKLKLEDSKNFAQVLLTPVGVTLDKLNYDAILSNLEILNKVGFEIEDFGSSMVIVRSAPTYLKFEDIQDTIIEMAEHLASNKKDISSSKIDWIYHSISCRAAIKAGSSLKFEEMTELVKKLKENSNIKYCPHGRPVSITIKKKEIEKQFGRI